MVSLTRVTRTRSFSSKRIGSTSSENLRPSKPHMKRSIFPVRWISIERDGGRVSLFGSSARRSV
ncbi:hypothetical protein D3C72_2581110 [compost metagenome]